MSDNIVKAFHDHSAMSVEQALESSKDLGYTSVIIIGYHDDGSYSRRSSAMLRKDALWLLENAKNHVLGDA